MTAALQRRRGEQVVGVALCLAGAVVLLVAAGRPWTTLLVEQAPDLPRTTVERSGREVAPLAAAAGVAGLGAVVGILATRGWARRAVGALAALFGLAGLAAILAPRSAGAVAGRLVAEEATAWPALTVVGAALLLGGGSLAAVRGHRWAAMGRRYDAPAAPGGLWEAIDRGEDPTIQPPSPPRS